MDHSFAFTQTGGFLGLPVQVLPISAGDASKRFAVTAICWDGCMANRSGARFDSNAICLASHMLFGDEHPYFDTTAVNDTVDIGNLPLPNTSLEAMRAALTSNAAATLVWTWLCGQIAKIK